MTKEIKVIDRTKPQVTSLELSLKITEALEEIGVSVDTRDYWSTIFKDRQPEIVTRETLTQEVPFEEWTYLEEGLRKGDVVPAYTTDDLFELLPGILYKSKNPEYFKDSNHDFFSFHLSKPFGKGSYLVGYGNIEKLSICSRVTNNLFSANEWISLPEALGKLLVYLIEEKIITN